MQEPNNNNEQTISAVIRVRNAAKQLGLCLRSLKSQTLPPGAILEIVIVDNDSVDDTVAVAMLNNAIVVSISKGNFSWGRALNRGISATKGEVILLLSADVCPADNNYICEMLKPLNDPEVAAVYGRQLPYADAPVDERVRLEKYFGPDRKRFDKNNCGPAPAGKGLIASNACAAIRRSAWQQMAYDEDIEAAEEGPWSYNIIQRGYAIVYQPCVRVYHSHRDGAFKLAWRHLELLKKDLSFKGIRLTKIRIFRWMAGLVKRRLHNCMCSNIPLSARIEGVFRLPIEIIAFAIVGFCPGNESLRPKLKWLFWH